MHNFEPQTHTHTNTRACRHFSKTKTNTHYMSSVGIAVQTRMSTDRPDSFKCDKTMQEAPEAECSECTPPRRKSCDRTVITGREDESPFFCLDRFNKRVCHTIKNAI